MEGLFIYIIWKYPYYLHTFSYNLFTLSILNVFYTFYPAYRFCFFRVLVSIDITHSNFFKFESMIILYYTTFYFKLLCLFKKRFHYLGKIIIYLCPASVYIISPYKHIARQVPISHYRSIQPREIGCTIRQKIGTDISTKDSYLVFYVCIFICLRINIKQRETVFHSVTTMRKHLLLYIPKLFITIQIYSFRYDHQRNFLLKGQLFQSSEHSIFVQSILITAN